MAREGRGLFKEVWKNLISSLRPKQSRGSLVGTDYLGNKYYEKPEDNKKKSSRWFMPKGGEEGNFDQEIPAEWEAWLRGRRLIPPSPEEIDKNLEIIRLKQSNAAQSGKKISPSDAHGEKLLSFPKYDDFEVYPGAKPNR